MYIYSKALYVQHFVGDFFPDQPDHNTGNSMPYSFTNSVWVLLHPTVIVTRVVRWDLLLIVLISKNVKSFYRCHLSAIIS